MVATRISLRPVIDGRLDDGAWQGASPSSAFTQKFPSEGQAPSERTVLRVVYDDEALYVGIDCEQRRAALTPRLTRRDRDLENDVSKLEGRPPIRADQLAVSIDSRRDGGLSAFHFVVNISGVRSDGVYVNDTTLDPSWDENWEARTNIRADGWSAELRIPLRILRFEEGPTRAFGINVQRSVAAVQEIDEWAFSPRSQGGFVSRFGTLDGLHGLRSQTRRLELRPFVVGKVFRQDAAFGLRGATGPLNLSTARTSGDGRSAGVATSIGLEARWHMTPDLSLDATLNPDFGQVEADQVVLNLSSAETFFAEKRPFFLEGAEAFQTNAPLLYTRRIGGVPGRPALAPGERAREDVAPSAIPAALKLVGRPFGGITVAALSAVSAENRLPIETPQGTRTYRVAAPLSTYNVLRLRSSVGANSYVGFMGTATNRFETGDSPSISGAEPCPKQRCFNDAYVASFDGRWQSPGGDYAASASAGSSVLKGGPPRVFADGTVLKEGTLGQGVGGEVSKIGGKHWLWALGGLGAGRNFETNDLGYLARQNIVGAWSILAYRTREPWFQTLETATRLELAHYRNFRGQILYDIHQLNSTWLLKNHQTIFLELQHRGSWSDDRAVGDGTALERVGLFGIEASIQGDPRRLVSGRLFVLAQRLSGGMAGRLEGSLVIRPKSWLDLELIPNVVHTQGEPRFVSLGDPDTLVFGRLSATQVGATLRATAAFTPNLTLQTYAQLFVTRAHYTDFSTFSRAPGTTPRISLSELAPMEDRPSTNPDFERAGLNASLILRWEYRLGSLLYVVYTRAQTPQNVLGPGQTPRLDIGALPRAPAADVLFLKLSWWWG